MKVKMITLGAMLVLISIVITGCTGLSRQTADQTGTELSGAANGEGGGPVNAYARTSCAFDDVAFSTSVPSARFHRNWTQ